MVKKKEKSVDLVNKVNASIIKANVIKSNQHILISMSGGQDSICTFFIFLMLKRQWNWSIGIIYCNHLWQSTSFFVASLIFKIAFIFKIPIFYSITSYKLNNEYKSRYWRYDIFHRISFFYKYNIIITGHTLTDKVETILLQLMRGGSVKSLYSLHMTKHFHSVNHFSQNFLIKKNYILNDPNLNLALLTKSFFFYFPKHSKQDDVVLPRKNKVFSTKTVSEPCRWALALSGKLVYHQKLVFNLTFFSVISPFNDQYLSHISTGSIHCYCIPISTYVKKHIVFFLPCYSINGIFFKQKVVLYNTNNYVRTLLINKTTSNKNLLIRPVLSLNRFDLKKLSFLWNLPIYPDKSNQINQYTRNRIRKQVMPMLRFFFNPQIDNTFFQFAKITGGEQDYFDILLDKLTTNFKEKNFSINTSLFRFFPKIIQKKLLKQFLEKITDKQIQWFQIEYISKKITKKNKNKLFNQNLQSIFYYKKIFFNSNFLINKFLVSKSSCVCFFVPKQGYTNFQKVVDSLFLAKQGQKQSFLFTTTDCPTRQGFQKLITKKKCFTNINKYCSLNLKKRINVFKFNTFNFVKLIDKKIPVPKEFCFVIRDQKLDISVMKNRGFCKSCNRKKAYFFFTQKVQRESKTYIIKKIEKLNILEKQNAQSLRKNDPQILITKPIQFFKHANEICIWKISFVTLHSFMLLKYTNYFYSFIILIYPEVGIILKIV